MYWEITLQMSKSYDSEMSGEENGKSYMLSKLLVGWKPQSRNSNSLKTDLR